MDRDYQHASYLPGIIHQDPRPNEDWYPAPRSAGGSVIHAKTPAGGIAGRAALQMSFASCDLYDCDQAGLLSDSGTNLDIWNPASAAVAELTYIVAARNTAGLWVVILEDCP